MNAPMGVFDALLRHGADMQKIDSLNRNALTLALEHRAKLAAESLLSHGFPVGTSTIDLTDITLHQFAAHGYTALLSLVLEQGHLDLEVVSRAGVTALGRAVLEEQLECMQLLIKHGADINAPVLCCCPEKHFHPLVIVAARESNAEILMCLIDHGAGPNVQSPHGNKDTALAWASQQGQTDCVRALLGIEGTEVNAVDNDGETALICAAKKGRFDIARLLLERRDVNRTIRNLKGKTAKDIAKDKGKRDVVRLFEAEEKGLDLQQVEIDSDNDDSEGGDSKHHGFGLPGSSRSTDG